MFSGNPYCFRYLYFGGFEDESHSCLWNRAFCRDATGGICVQEDADGVDDDATDLYIVTWDVSDLDGDTVTVDCLPSTSATFAPTLAARPLL